MHAIEFLKDPAKVALKPVYAVYGDDAFLRRETLQEIGRAALPGGEDDDLSVARFPGDSANLADVLDELRTLPFFSKRRLVIVEGGRPVRHGAPQGAGGVRRAAVGERGARALGQGLAVEHEAGQARREGRAGGRVQGAARPDADPLAGPRRQGALPGRSSTRGRPSCCWSWSARRWGCWSPRSRSSRSTSGRRGRSTATTWPGWSAPGGSRPSGSCSTPRPPAAATSPWNTSTAWSRPASTRSACSRR